MSDVLIVQLVRAEDGNRTAAVALTKEDLLKHLRKLSNQDDFLLVLHDVSYENFSLHPLVKISTYLEINGDVDHE